MDVLLALALVLAMSPYVAHAVGAPPNTVPFSSKPRLGPLLMLRPSSALPSYLSPRSLLSVFSLAGVMYGTWTGTCTQSAYVNPNMPDAIQCALSTSLDEYYTYPFS